MVLIANYLRNRMPVIRRDITPYKSKTGLQTQLGHLCHIGQQEYAQDQKPQTRWKKFSDRATVRTLVRYKRDHIYQMLMSNGKVMRFSRVDWIGNLLPIISPPSSSSTLCNSPNLSLSPSLAALSRPLSSSPSTNQR